MNNLPENLRDLHISCTEKVLDYLTAIAIGAGFGVWLALELSK